MEPENPNIKTLVIIKSKFVKTSSDCNKDNINLDTDHEILCTLKDNIDLVTHQILTSQDDRFVIELISKCFPLFVEVLNLVRIYLLRQYKNMLNVVWILRRTCEIERTVKDYLPVPPGFRPSYLSLICQSYIIDIVLTSHFFIKITDFILFTLL